MEPITARIFTQRPQVETRAQKLVAVEKGDQSLVQRWNFDGAIAQILPERRFTPASSLGDSAEATRLRASTVQPASGICSLSNIHWRIISSTVTPIDSALSLTACTSSGRK